MGRLQTVGAAVFARGLGLFIPAFPRFALPSLKRSVTGQSNSQRVKSASTIAAIQRKPSCGKKGGRWPGLGCVTAGLVARSVTRSVTNIRHGSLQTLKNIS